MFLKVYLFCVFTVLQRVIKELNVKFEIKETPHGIKREMIILQYCI